MINDIKIGADPEVFVKRISSGEFVPSLDLIGGSKFCPRELQDGIFVQEDNVLLEFNIPASSTQEEFKANILNGLKLSKECFLAEGFDIEIKSSHKFTPEQLLDPRAQELGCDPDFNAWLGGKKNPRPKSPKDGLRTAAGHIHIGFELDNPNDAAAKDHIDQELVRWADFYLGVPSILMDSDTERRKLYGKAGAFRHKPYGVEYRTLSSFWLGAEKLIDWAYEQTMRAVESVKNGHKLARPIENAIQVAINQADKDAANYLVEKYDLKVVA